MMKKLIFMFFAVAIFTTVSANNFSSGNYIQPKKKITSLKKLTGPNDPIGPTNQYTYYLPSCGYSVRFEAFSEVQAHFVASGLDDKCRKQQQQLIADVN